MGVDAAARPRRGGSALGTAARYPDVPLVVVAAIVAIVLGAPALGCVLGAGVWLLNRVLEVLDTRWTRRPRAPRGQVTASLFERFGRIWLLAAGIIVAGVAGGRPDGLAAAIFVFGAYTLVFVIRLFSGPPPASDEL